MEKRKRSRHVLWWLIGALVVVLAGLGLYYYFQYMQDREAGVQEVLPPSETQPSTTWPPKEAAEPPSAKEEKPETHPMPAAEEPAPAAEKEDPCQRVQSNIKDFFQYLDHTDYFQRLDSKEKAYDRFTSALRTLCENPPVPAGEGLDSKILLKNMYLFFRILDTQDISLIKTVIHQEKDTLEFHLRMFYRWLTLRERCPDPEGLRPSQECLYRYAGFFLNTAGGRAYLMRRHTKLRLLIHYYSLLIVHRADVEGTNSHGINIPPFIEALQEEMRRYTDLEYHGEYMARLKKMEDYYESKR